MSEQRKLLIQFEDVSPVEATQLADTLARELPEKAPGVETKVVKPDPATMDPGSLVAIVLGTEAAVAIAYGICSLLQRWGAKVSVTETVIGPDGTEDRKVVIENVSGSDAARIVAALQSGKQE